MRHCATEGGVRGWNATHRHSFFGKQCDSRKASPASATFGGDPRELPGFRSEVPSKVRALASHAIHRRDARVHQNGSWTVAVRPQDHYYTKHHVTINLCKYSPGPKYGASSSLGEWPTRPAPWCVVREQPLLLLCLLLPLPPSCLVCGSLRHRRHMCMACDGAEPATLTGAAASCTQGSKQCPAPATHQMPPSAPPMYAPCHPQPAAGAGVCGGTILRGGAAGSGSVAGVRR